MFNKLTVFTTKINTIYNPGIFTILKIYLGLHAGGFNTNMRIKTTTQTPLLEHKLN